MESRGMRRAVNQGPQGGTGRHDAELPICETEVEFDSSLPRLAFEDAAAFSLAGDPRLEPVPIAEIAF